MMMMMMMRQSEATAAATYLMPLDEHHAHDNVLADILRLGKTNALNEPRLLLLRILNELEEHERLIQSRLPLLTHVTDAVNNETPLRCRHM